MNAPYKHRQSITFSSEAMRIIEANKGTESFSETVNRLIVRAGTIEGDNEILFRLLDLQQRDLALLNAVFEKVLVGEVEEARKDFLQSIRNEA